MEPRGSAFAGFPRTTRSKWVIYFSGVTEDCIARVHLMRAFTY